LQFKEPRRISGISTDGSYAFVDGNSTGLPVDELTHKEAPAGVPEIATRLPENKAMRQDVFSLTEGTITIQWPTPLSADSIQDVKEWLKIVERKITRSTTLKESVAATEEEK
jgi:hypothetical protein